MTVLEVGVYLVVAVGVAAVIYFVLSFASSHGERVAKWESALDDSSKSMKLQEDILEELKAVRSLLEKRTR